MTDGEKMIYAAVWAREYEAARQKRIQNDGRYRDVFNFTHDDLAAFAEHAANAAHEAVRALSSVRLGYLEREAKVTYDVFKSRGRS